ncbi:phosphotransferase [Sediminibacillus massiliensis]|uniref:phosphotransferase n=1 Tax=Sediminibacillus massiliensis TaxID=1926277 RepID=UPI0009886E42|nr:phosphotransferase [Sediminibacillus massiliensis]
MDKHFLSEMPVWSELDQRCMADFCETVSVWINKEIAKAGLIIIGKGKQVKANDYCLVQRIPTNKGDVYFKASGPASLHESILTKHLASTFPGNLVSVIAAQEKMGWLLMKDLCGEALREKKDKKLWQRAIQEYAEIQVSEADNVHLLLSMGIPDRRMKVLKEEIFNHLAGMCTTGLSAAETVKIMSLKQELMEACDELDSILPPSIDHGDLHSNNIRLSEGRLVFFDWGDASVTHPFFSTRVFWNALDDLAASELEWLELINEFRPYYLEPWTKFASIDNLEKALLISDELACVQRALSWYLYLSPSKDKISDSFTKPAQWLQLYMEHRTLIGK